MEASDGGINRIRVLRRPEAEGAFGAFDDTFLAVRWVKEEIMLKAG